MTNAANYDSNGMEREPFEYHGDPLPRRSTRRPAYRGHGPLCSPDPEIGCVCGEDEEESLRAEVGTVPSCPKCGHEAIDFTAPCPSCGVDWSRLVLA